eukprot:NODE_184_length_2394_cov_61.409793_g179_i0.p1 GENE.NODE_184_length_2394_cov_61.409793_g179_i0~~NODE_184_length_2394_cov_61.409793_g179_i0.p1  ORF type:complete len:753 (+),score=97.55 NODE_184_length_2394_cov_61.409793_g179_i0:94-2352(+)
MWYEKYAPKTGSDCLVAARQTDAVRDWARRLDSVLLLTGPPGCGKSSLVRAILRESGYLVVDELDPTMDIDPAQQVVVWSTFFSIDQTAVDDFEEFLSDRHAPPMGVHRKRPGALCRVLVVRDLPRALTGTDKARITAALQRSLDTTRKGLHPLVFIHTVADTHAAKFNIAQYFPREFLAAAALTKVECRALTEARIRKRVQVICQQERAGLTLQEIRHIAEAARGDMRTALLQAHWQSIGSRSRRANFQDIDLPGSRKRSRSSTEAEAQEPKRRARDTYLQSGHATSRFLFAKREPVMHGHSLGKLEHTAEDTCDRLTITEERFLGWVHNNMIPRFVHKVDASLVEISDAYSVADARMERLCDDSIDGQRSRFDAFAVHDHGLPAARRTVFSAALRTYHVLNTVPDSARTFTPCLPPPHQLHGRERQRRQSAIAAYFQPVLTPLQVPEQEMRQRVSLRDSDERLEGRPMGCAAVEAEVACCQVLPFLGRMLFGRPPPPQPMRYGTAGSIAAPRSSGATPLTRPTTQLRPAATPLIPRLGTFPGSASSATPLSQRPTATPLTQPSQQPLATVTTQGPRPASPRTSGGATPLAPSLVVGQSSQQSDGRVSPACGTSPLGSTATPLTRSPPAATPLPAASLSQSAASALPRLGVSLPPPAAAFPPHPPVTLRWDEAVTLHELCCYKVFGGTLEMRADNTLILRWPSHTPPPASLTHNQYPQRRPFPSAAGSAAQSPPPSVPKHTELDDDPIEEF